MYAVAMAILSLFGKSSNEILNFLSLIKLTLKRQSKLLLGLVIPVKEDLRSI